MQEINESLKLVLSRQFGIEPDKIHNETHLVDDLGADSLDLMEIVMIIESKFKVRIEESEYNNALVVNDIINLINQKQQKVSPHSLKYHIHENGWTVILDDFDFAKANQDDVNELAWLLATNTLVVAKNQNHLTIDDQLRVVHMFGDVEDLSHFGDVPPYTNFTLPGSQGKIARVTGELDEHGEPGLFGHVSDLDWHCNQPGMSSRKPLVWLFGIKGTAGSRTSWTNNILAYHDLSDEWKEKIKDLKLICGWKKDSYSEYDFGKAKSGITEDFNEHYTPSLVHTNNGGKTGLFFPFLQFRNFVGMSEKESLDIVEPLRDHILQDKYIYHHDWQDGDIVISEQWLGIHKRWEFAGMPNRILHRITFDYKNSNIVAKLTTK